MAGSSLGSGEGHRRTSGGWSCSHSSGRNNGISHPSSIGDDYRVDPSSVPKFRSSKGSRVELFAKSIHQCSISRLSIAGLQLDAVKRREGRGGNILYPRTRPGTTLVLVRERNANVRRSFRLRSASSSSSFTYFRCCVTTGVRANRPVTTSFHAERLRGLVNTRQHG